MNDAESGNEKQTAVDPTAKRKKKASEKDSINPSRSANQMMRPATTRAKREEEQSMRI